MTAVNLCHFCYFNLWKGENIRGCCLLMQERKEERKEWLLGSAGVSLCSAGGCKDEGSTGNGRGSTGNG